MPRRYQRYHLSGGIIISANLVSVALKLIPCPYLKTIIMNVLAEKVFIGKWRSFKIFKPLGDILLHSEKCFREFNFMCDRRLIVKALDGTGEEVLVNTDKWSISFQKKKHFLNILSPKMIFEVITVNHTVLVLLDIDQGDKIFFAREQQWPHYLKLNHTVVI